MRIAFLGTGHMGLPMARNLAAAGHRVAAWNRSRGKAEPLAADGVRIAGTPAEAAPRDFRGRVSSPPRRRAAPAGRMDLGMGFRGGNSC